MVYMSVWGGEGEPHVNGHSVRQDYIISIINGAYR